MLMYYVNNWAILVVLPLDLSTQVQVHQCGCRMYSAREGRKIFKSADLVRRHLVDVYQTICLQEYTVMMVLVSKEQFTHMCTKRE